MKKIATLVLTVYMAAPLAAAELDRAPQLPPIDAGMILNQIQQNNHNIFPQPNPVKPDLCTFTEFKNNKCFFKCESGDILTEPAIKPDFSTGEPAGACATHIIRTIPAGPQFRAASDVQTYKSYALYPTEKDAKAALTWALNGLKFAKAEVTAQAVTPVSGGYAFSVQFRAAAKLAIEPGPTFSDEQDAYERMFDAAERIEGTVATYEVAKYEDRYYYVIGFFPSDRGARAARGPKACFFDDMKGNTCMYKCAGGSAYSMPAQRPDPMSEFQTACPAVVFPF